MTPKEAIQALKQINLKRVHPFYSWEEMKEVRDIAIEALEKQIEKKPIIKSWNPAICPTCGEELSESCGDGYYKHYEYLEVCKCGQKLNWREEE